MQHFKYKAIDASGNNIVASCQAESRSEAVLHLKSLGLTTTSLEAVRIRPQGLAKLGNGVVNRFYSMLGNQLQVGVPMLNAIELIAKQERSAESKRFVQSIAHSVASGNSLSKSLEPHAKFFSDVDVNLIRAGEEGGFLPDALERISQMREWQQRLTANVWGAAAYPALLICVSAVLIPGIIIFLVPKLEPIFTAMRRNAELPFATSMLLDLSKFIRVHGFNLVGVIALAVAIILWLTPRRQLLSLRDKNILKLPYVGAIVRDFILARFFRIFGTLLQNKIQLLQALHISTSVLGNKHLASRLQDAEETVASGRLLVHALEQKDFISAEALAMIGVAEQSNTLDSVLLKIAEQMEVQTNRRLDVAVKLIEPALLLLMAVVVGFVVLALLLPIFEGQAIG